MSSLSLSAVRQILTASRKSLKPEEEEELIKRIEESANKFDPSGKGELSDKEMFNVLKIQNKVECKQEQVGCMLLSV
jgi:Asp-tRNA(Asn)/Glu-tRNA(Gln) amidotransferase C subunit